MRKRREILREPQPWVSDLLRGKIAKISLETLVNYAEALDMRPENRIHEPVTATAGERVKKAGIREVQRISLQGALLLFPRGTKPIWA